MPYHMDSYVCGVNIRSERFSFHQIYILKNEGVPEADRNVFNKQKEDLTK